MFATSFQEHVGWMILFMGMGLWALNRVLTKADPDGKVKGAAKGKILGWLLNRLK